MDNILTYPSYGNSMKEYQRNILNEEHIPMCKYGNFFSYIRM